MKKSLIAAAAMAFAGMAAAQSSVTLYGIADIWVGKGEAVTNDKVAAGSGGVATSRWGIKGSEDLGGGLKAHFNFESAVNLGNGATNAKMFDRQANVGFGGGFGTIKLGRSFNALDDIYGVANSGFDSALSANAVWKNGYAGAADAQLYYATPSFGGFSGAVSTQLNGNSSNGATKISSFHVKYEGGPVYAGVGYEEDKSGGQKGTLVNGSYDLGVAKLMASYYTTKPIGGGAKTNSYQLGADVPLSSALTLSAGYASSKVKGGGKSATGFGLAAAYAMSKRTTLYGGVRTTNNEASNDFWAVGINHKF